MMYTIESPNDAARKLLELINGFSKVDGYKINTQLNFSTVTKISEEKLMKQLHLPSHQKE